MGSSYIGAIFQDGRHKKSNNVIISETIQPSNMNLESIPRFSWSRNPIKPFLTTSEYLFSRNGKLHTEAINPISKSNVTYTLLLVNIGNNGKILLFTSEFMLEILADIYEARI